MIVSGVIAEPRTLVKHTNICTLEFPTTWKFRPLQENDNSNCLSTVFFRTIVTLDTPFPLKTLKFFHLPHSSLNCFCVKVCSLIIMVKSNNCNLSLSQSFIVFLYVLSVLYSLFIQYFIYLTYTIIQYIVLGS